MPKIAMVTLGCPKNVVDSDCLLEGLGREGFVQTPDIETAELVLVNTCGFIEAAKRESIEEILRLTRARKRGGKLLVFGCLAKRYGNALREEIPEIDALWGVGENEKIIEYCKRIELGVRGSKAGDKTDEEGIARGSEMNTSNPSSYAYLKVAEGCSRGCTYCVIPSIRGPFRSAEPEKVLQRAEQHIKAGVKELVLVAQDLGSYGREFKGYGLPSLVREIASLYGDFRVRLLYLNPSSITDELLRVVRDGNKVCKYLDIPLQHSEDGILKAMGRGGTRRSIVRTIRKVRETIPGVALRTTLIVGFPGETDEDFEGLKDFVKEMRFEHLGVFSYSKEEGTPASKMRGQVPQKTMEKRRDEIMRLQSAISFEKNSALVGKRRRVLVDEIDRDTVIGRLSSQAPEIDGVVIIDKAAKRQAAIIEERYNNAPLLTLHCSRALRAGEFVEVEIVEAYDYDLKGRLIS